MRKGIAVSPGVSVGTAYCIHNIFIDPVTTRLADEEITHELAKYEAARDEVSNELQSLQRKVQSQVGAKEAAIFEAHEAILRDSAFTKNVRNWIVNDRLPAQAGLQRLLTDYTKMFERMTDPYLRDRLTDVRDVIIRLSNRLANVKGVRPVPVEGPVIIVADELLPSQVASLEDIQVEGIVTQRGSRTSHAAIIARSRGIPAVSGAKGILRLVKSGDTIVVDGREGIVDINPDSEGLAAYRKLQREFVDLQDQLAENFDLPAQTKDGVSLELLANINGVVDAKSANQMGADGIGLFRTEYLFLTHSDVPDEEEQLAVYRQVVKESPGKVITIRTLDIGGDKTIPYLGRTDKEANPFMGWRSIRLSFEHPDFFMAQIRAVLRAADDAAANGGQIRLMFPMITTLEEMRRVRGIVRRSIRNLEAQKKAYRPIPIGMMLEVPAAAVSIDMIMEAADFVSIGSNDLVQYLMAADRDNPKVSHLCQPLSPPVLRVLNQTIRTCNGVQKPITLCGEMAGEPSAFVLLLGMGLRHFSMSPAFIPRIKKLASVVSIPVAEELLSIALKLKTSVQIKKFISKRVKEIDPSLALLDTV